MKGSIVKSGLLHCKDASKTIKVCQGCPYYNSTSCTVDLKNDSLDYIKFLEERLITVASAITSKGFLTTEEKQLLFDETIKFNL